MRQLFAITLTVLLVLAAAADSAAQGKPRRLSTHQDWDAMVAGSGSAKVCYVISVPKKTWISRKGASRGDIYMTVTHRPAFGVRDEVNVVVGYPIRRGSEARISVDGKKSYQFFTEGSGAWAYDPKDDRSVVAAMKAGINLEVRATSQRGTDTRDTFSLRGFTAAYSAASSACR
jgi:invasion protein IalB